MNIGEVHAFHASVKGYKFFGSGIEVYERRLRERILPILEEINKRNGVIFDVGTGNGDFLKEVKERFPNIVVLGSTLARPNNPAVDGIIIANSAKDWPIKDNSIDRVFSVFSFCYFGDITKALIETRRVLKEDGKAHIHLGGIEDIIIDGENSLRFFENTRCIPYTTVLERIVSSWYRVDVVITIDKTTPIPILQHIKSDIIGHTQVNYLKSTGEFA